MKKNITRTMTIAVLGSIIATNSPTKAMENLSDDMKKGIGIGVAITVASYGVYRLGHYLVYGNAPTLEMNLTEKSQQEILDGMNDKFEGNNNKFKKELVEALAEALKRQQTIGQPIIPILNLEEARVSRTRNSSLGGDDISDELNKSFFVETPTSNVTEDDDSSMGIQTYQEKLQDRWDNLGPKAQGVLTSDEVSLALAAKLFQVIKTKPTQDTIEIVFSASDNFFRLKVNQRLELGKYVYKK